MVAQPLSQPSPCSIVSMVRCVVPERDGRGDRDVVVIDRLGEILPLLRLGQLVGLGVALVPHDAVAGSGKAEIEALRDR